MLDSVVTPWLLVMLVLTLVVLFYVSRWYRKHPWYKENDASTKLSVNERAYRRKERQKLSNMFLAYMMALGLILLIMVITVQLSIAGTWKLGFRWMYVLPFIGMMVLAGSGIKKE